MSSLDCLRPRPRLALVVVRVVAVDLGLVLASRVDRPRERGRSLLLRRLPATAEVPALLTRMMRPLLMLPLVVLRVAVLPASLALVEVLQVVLLRPELRRLGLVQARLHQRGDQHLDVPALLVDGLPVGARAAQVEVARLVHSLDGLSVPIGIRRVLRCGQRGFVVAEASCCIQGRTTPVQNLPGLCLSTGSLVVVYARVYIDSL